MSQQLFKFKFAKTKPTVVGSGDTGQQNKELILSDSVFRQLRDEIYKLCGIYYTESKKYLLEGRISKRIAYRKMNSYEEYLNYIKSPGSRQEINSLFEVITINETYFFRAEQQFDAFENIILPEILKLKSGIIPSTFRIWSAASSTGEEAYTLAMIVLQKLKPKYPHINFQILASDINNAVLETARKGIYKEYAVRNVPPEFMAKYFTQSGNTYILSNEVKRMVKFMKVNLYDPVEMKAFSNCNVIFCCNVLIYFDIPSKQQVVAHLYNALQKNGYLFIGYSESLHGISKAFKLIHLPKAMAYKKE